MKLDEVKRQEREQLEEQSLPMRNYLMRHVMPTLTSALIDVCKVRPQDPVDYLVRLFFYFMNVKVGERYFIFTS